VISQQHPKSTSAPVSGYCRDCDKLHYLSADKAITYCKELMLSLQKFKQLDFETGTSDPELSTDHLYSDMGGKMFGVLVCEDSDGNEVILKAFSGKFNNRRTVPGWVPHLFDEAKFNAVIEEGNTGIHPLTAQISGLEKGSPDWKTATAERRQISLGILAKLYALYEVTNFRQETRSLSGAFRFSKSIPTGTGDCCAPKLLNFAARNNLKPLGIAEFYLGKASASGERIEGNFYPPCDDKCAPLLGFMLCGI